MAITVKNFTALAVFVQSMIGDRCMFASELETLMDCVQNTQEPPSTEPAKVNLVPLFDAICDGKKIEAIKEHRLLTGMFLKESKDEIERLMNKIPHSY